MLQSIIIKIILGRLSLVSYYCAKATLADDCINVFGGLGDNNNKSNTAIVYNPKDNASDT
eukprot:Pgem_evm1s10380